MSSKIRPILNKFHQPIGLMMEYHQLLYEGLVNVIWSFVRVEEVHTMLSHITSFQSRIDLFSQLAHLHFKNKRILKRINSIVEELGAVNTERNRIVHGKWAGVSSEFLSVAKYTRNKKLTWEIHRYTPEKIDAIATRMLRLYQKIWKIQALVDKSATKARHTAKRGRSLKTRNRITPKP